MSSPRSKIPIPLRRILLVLILMTTVFSFVFAVHRIFQDSTPGIDLYDCWQAARAVFIERVNPYSQEITDRIQMGIYGSLARPDQDPMRFNYPPFILLPILPLVGLTFDWVQAVYFSIQFFVLLAAILLLNRGAPLWLTLFPLLSYQFVFGMFVSNFNMLITAILLFALVALTRQPSPSSTVQVTLGILLAWSAGKPQFSWPFLLFFTVIALRRRMIPLCLSFVLSGVVLLIFSFWAFPGWVPAWWGQLTRYISTHPSRPPLQDYLTVLLSFRLTPPELWGARILCLGLLFILVIQWIRGRIKDQIALTWLAALGYLLHPNGMSNDQILFIIPLMVWAASRTESRRSSLVWWIITFLTGYLTLPLNSLSVLWPNRFPFVIFLVWAVWVTLRENRVQPVQNPAPAS